MKRWIVLTASLGLALSTLSAAQAQTQTAHSKNKKVTISGKVMNDGAGISESERRTWLVVNSEILRAHVGQIVTAKGLLDAATGRVQVWSLKLTTPVTAVARIGDSAFRR
jgi:hypothetical protein